VGVILTTRPVDPRDVIDFDQFFLEHHTRLIACGLALTSDGERARDAAQEALARAFRDWDKVARLDHPGAWVRRVLLNLLADEGRRDGRARRIVAVPDRHEDVRPSDSPLLAAIRRLPTRQREAVVLHYLDDLPVEDVARVMKVAVGTVKATLHQARAGLAAELQEDPS
jgi:RNA polymerase sigma-70 factor (ECF subfamily)